MYVYFDLPSAVVCLQMLPVCLVGGYEVNISIKSPEEGKEVRRQVRIDRVGKRTLGTVSTVHFCLQFFKVQDGSRLYKYGIDEPLTTEEYSICACHHHGKNQQ